eukprot:Em0002g799a
MNRKLTCGVPELHPIPVKSPWYMIGIDFIGPISPPGEDGSQYILIISDYFTKWVEAIPTPDKTATTVANCLFKIFMRMGLPRVMLSDNGSEFCNKLNDKLAEILGVKRRLTTPYHPQANGLDERYNQTLQNMLAKFVSTKQTVWSSYLDTCTFAYNTSRHESSTYTPFQLMFGRQAILPVDIDLQKESGDELHHKYQMLNDPDIVAVQHKHQVILEDAKKHILDAQKKQKQKYDSKCAKPNCFQVGELVMKKNFRRKKMKGGKLQDRFDGPHRVVKKMPHGVYELISKDGTLIRATGGHLKMYHSNMLQGSISFDDKHLMTSKPPAKIGEVTYGTEHKCQEFTTDSSVQEKEMIYVTFIWTSEVQIYVSDATSIGIQTLLMERCAKLDLRNRLSKSSDESNLKPVDKIQFSGYVKKLTSFNFSCSLQADSVDLSLCIAKLTSLLSSLEHLKGDTLDSTSELSNLIMSVDCEQGRAEFRGVMLTAVRQNVLTRFTTAGQHTLMQSHPASRIGLMISSHPA